MTNFPQSYAINKWRRYNWNKITVIQSLIVSLVTRTKGRRRGGGGRGKWKRKRKMRKKEGRKEERKKYFPVGCHQFLFSFLFYSIIFTNVLLKH